MRLPTVAEIEAMDRAALTAAWDQFFKTPVPKSLSRPFLRRFLAFEVQARRMGGLPKGFVASLQNERAHPTAAALRSSRLKPGGRILREWNGVTHIVDVADEGFRWNGTCHKTLSSVARAITGARWSGPRFFGLRDGGG